MLGSLPKHMQVRNTSLLILFKSAALQLATVNANFYTLDSRQIETLLWKHPERRSSSSMTHS
jgi:hypothetical protein